VKKLVLVLLLDIYRDVRCSFVDVWCCIVVYQSGKFRLRKL
jgi:hypothetical protein